MVKDAPLLRVDYRGGSKDLIEPLLEMGLPVVEDDMPSGDIVFTGRGEKGVPVEIGIEFKKLGELIGSLQTQRLQGHQLLKMRKAFAFSYLLTEGELMWNSQGVLTKWARVRGVRTLVPIPGNMRVNEFLKRIHVLHLRGGLNPLWSPNRQDTLKQIEVLYRVWTDQDLDEHKSHLAIYQAPMLLEATQFRKTVHTLPEVGLRVSGAAEKKFDSSLRKAICLSTIDDWANIETTDKHGNTKRLGEKTARKIMEAIR